MVVLWLVPLILNTFQLYRPTKLELRVWQLHGCCVRSCRCELQAFLQLSTSLCPLAPLHALGVACTEHWQLQERWSFVLALLVNCCTDR
jgi:hypothetical protein